MSSWANYHVVWFALSPQLWLTLVLFLGFLSRLHSLKSSILTSKQKKIYYNMLKIKKY